MNWKFKTLSILLFWMPAISQEVSGQKFEQGIKAEYYNGINFDFFVLSRTEKKIGFWRELKSPARGVGREHFSIRYVGSVKAPRTGLYNFHVVSDDGVRVRVNHELLIDAWVDQEATAYIGSIMLDKDEIYDIEIQYYNTVVHSVLNIRWELPMETYQLFDLARQPEIFDIPADALITSRSDAKQRKTLLVGRGLPQRQSSAISADSKNQTRTLKRQATSRSKTDGIVENEPIILRTVGFDQQSSVLKSNASTELDNLIKYLKTYEKKKIQITGHTDYLGDSLDNHILSEQRAKTVAQYLIKGGIDTTRISSQGFGGNLPLIINKNLKERDLNRRVEFTIVD
jgi:outer membrane protein OmpA-like peptidoglycan-associated protein